MINASDLSLRAFCWIPILFLLVGYTLFFMGIENETGYSDPPIHPRQDWRTYADRLDLENAVISTMPNEIVEKTTPFPIENITVTTSTSKTPIEQKDDSVTLDNKEDEITTTRKEIVEKTTPFTIENITVTTSRTSTSKTPLEQKNDSVTLDNEDERLYNEWIAERREINDLRVRRVHQVCQKYPDEIEFETLDAERQYLFVESLKVLGCTINKAGSTTLRRTFHKLRKKVDEIKAKKHLMDPAFDIFNKRKKRDKYNKFIFIREPFERLASAYNDKMIANESPSLKSFRKAVKKSAMEIKGISKDISGYNATFDDFLVAKVINSNETVDDFGRHWAPYYKICAPCTVKYDYIGLLNLEETKFIWDILGISNHTKHKEIDWKNGKLITSNNANSKDQVLGQLYSTASRSTLIQVYQKYKFDYELYGFDFNKVLQLAGYPILTKRERLLTPIFY